MTKPATTGRSHPSSTSFWYDKKKLAANPGTYLAMQRDAYEAWHVRMTQTLATVQENTAAMREYIGDQSAGTGLSPPAETLAKACAKLVFFIEGLRKGVWTPRAYLEHQRAGIAHVRTLCHANQEQFVRAQAFYRDASATLVGTEREIAKEISSTASTIVDLYRQAGASLERRIDSYTNVQAWLYPPKQ